MQYRTLAICLFSILCSLALQSCGLFKLQKDLEEITAELSIFTGVVQHDQAPGQAIVVLAKQHSDSGKYVISDYRFPDNNGLFSFQAQNGIYKLMAFIDQNADFIYQIGEPATVLAKAPLVNRLGDNSKTWKIDELTIDSTFGTRDLGIAIDVSSNGLTAIERTATTMGVGIDFNSPRFDEEAIAWGMWQPAQWFTKVGYGFYLTEPWGVEPKPLLVLIHGINSSPREFEPMLKQLDTSKYRVALFHYPSGLSIDDNAYILSQIINEMLIRAPSQDYVLLAHSMGGLLAKRLIHMQASAAQAQPLKNIISISTPWLGHKSAESGVERSPVMVPVWEDLSPSSRFIRLLGKYEIPQHIDYTMLFSHSGNSLLQSEQNDGSVSLESMLDPRMQDRAKSFVGVDADHVGIVSHERTVKFVQQALDALSQY